MPTLKYKTLVRPSFLKGIGRSLLNQFLAEFQQEFNANGLSLPPPDAPEDVYFGAIEGLLAEPERLPARFNEAAAAIEDLSRPMAFQFLQSSPHWPEMKSLADANGTRCGIALQLWLSRPDLLLGVRKALKFTRLTAFEYASAVGAAADPQRWTDQLALLELATGLDRWFAQNCRGSETTRVEVYPLRGEVWFLVRHGDVFTCAPKVEKQRTAFVHFRPERDDVVVYSPASNMLRVNARTQGERDLYFRQFGIHLGGGPDYFRERRTYSLEPLRERGPELLSSWGVDGIGRVNLRELAIVSEDESREVTTRVRDGFFKRPGVIPIDGRLSRAIFEIQFATAARAYPVEVRVPNMLKVSRRCDPLLVDAWLSRAGIRQTGSFGVQQETTLVTTL